VSRILGIDYGTQRIGLAISDSLGLTARPLLESGMKRRDRKGTVDKVAAAIILQTYLDSLNSNAMPEPTDEPSPNQ
jgi:RNase H-fold protein (predicted Holliday junction resolvase)